MVTSLLLLLCVRGRHGVSGLTLDDSLALSHSPMQQASVRGTERRHVSVPSRVTLFIMTFYNGCIHLTMVRFFCKIMFRVLRPVLS